ncbi:MAG TPA: DUF1638 domain-containing protein [Acidobacteriota bacterium]|nr:DUF1638 domain-containing protein [Acidobacteriota bacterium]
MSINPDTCKLIACATVIEEMRPLMPPQLSHEILDFGLHSNPERLHKALQSAVDAVSPNIETILLGFGMCAKATVGLKAANRTMVIPKADDCITIFLGSVAQYNQQQRHEPGTLYLTKGWIESGTPLDEQREIMAKKYGEEKAGFLFKKMLQGYKRLVFIDTGNYELGQYRSRSQKMAERLGLRYDEIKGDNTLVKALLNGPWDGDFVVAPPGHTVALSDFRKF